MVLPVRRRAAAEILGEALARIRDLERPIFEQIPEAARVVALRKIIIHGYDAVDPKVLWAIVEDRLPELRALLSRLLEEARRQGLERIRGPLALIRRRQSVAKSRF